MERALAATDPSAQATQPAPPPPAAPKWSLTDPFVGINPPPPEMLTEVLEKSQRQQQAQAEPSRGCSLARRTESPGERRRSNSRP